MLINALAAGLMLIAADPIPVPVAAPDAAFVEAEASQLPRPFSATEHSRQFDSGLQRNHVPTEVGNGGLYDYRTGGNGYYSGDNYSSHSDDGGNYGKGETDCQNCLDGNCRRHRCYWHEWWHSPNDLIQHMPYYPSGHGYYYFRPYNYQHIRYHQEAVTVWGGDPRNPYDNHVFDAVYAELESERPKAFDEELQEVPDLPPLPGTGSEEEGDDVPELPKEDEDDDDRESRLRTNVIPTSSRTGASTSQVRLKLVQ